MAGEHSDVSILEIKGEIKEVLASYGDTCLGGDDFDERLKKNHLLGELRKQAGKEALREDTDLKVRLLDVAERAKMSLSDHPYVKVNEVAMAILNGRPLNLDLELTREQFQSLTADLIERTMTKVMKEHSKRRTWVRKKSERSSWSAAPHECPLFMKHYRLFSINP